MVSDVESSVESPSEQVIERQLHPMSWLFSVARNIKAFIFPLVIALVAGGDKYQIYAAWLVIPGIAISLLQNWVYRYILDVNEIIVREGILFKNVRHVPYEKIQNLNLIRNPIHRLLNVAQVELESASGGKPEAVIRVISMKRIDELQAKLNSAAKQDIDSSLDNTVDEEVPEEASKSSSILSLELLELVKMGIISNKGMVVVAAFMGIFYQMPNIENKAKELLRNSELFSQLSLQGNDPLSIAMLVLGGAVCFLIFIRILSIAFAIVTYYGFKLVEKDNKLVASYGLLTHINATLPAQKIQLLTVRETLLHRWFKRSAVRVETAGGGSSEQGATTRLVWLAPIIPSASIDDFLHQVQPDVDTHVEQWLKADFGGWLRMTRVRSFWLTLITLPLSYWLSSYFLLLFLMLPLIVIHARRYVASIRYGFSSNAIVYMSGWLIKQKTIVPFHKMQSVSLEQSFFDKRTNMASIVADNAGLEIMRHHIDIPFLPQQQARESFDFLYEEICHTEYRWK
ncbi:PH domain-containing protein [Pleionea sp. CnH1-48]|uniref:PH domain-containing protein n=1 Tax=Pleionea sp. CnH1-48 TaxID=2954494 RepID=UPI002097F78B|nr:PH domain-containing protein [Pleionea sp. CnH1-48]MCO7225678.1 PH domain-containing protein [Pleionea sp. CnH1-48]